MLEQPARAARLSALKLGMLWNHREYPQIENVDEFRAAAQPAVGPTFEEEK